MSAWQIIEGDCVEQMAKLPEASVDAVVCDPPYGLEFMGKEWDRLAATPGYNERGRITERPDSQVPYGRGGGVNSYQAGKPMQDWHEAWAREALRVLKPGGHLLAFGGTRTYHRLACAVEDAGFEIRDSLIWIYGSGFPKSLDVSKAIDKAAGAEREVVGEQRLTGTARRASDGRSHGAARTNAADEVERAETTIDITAPATPEAEAWQGWGTALKPAHEPIVVARKPLAGTVVGNVQKFGTGALNVDGCRVGAAGEVVERGEFVRNSTPDTHEGYQRPGASSYTDKPAERSGPANTMGRWPANVALTHAEDCRMVGERRVKASLPAGGPTLTGESTSTSRGKFNGVETAPNYADEDGMETVEAWECVEGCPVAELDRQSGESTSRQGESRTGVAGNGWGMSATGAEYADSGGASRFFYTSKASRAERNAGLDNYVRDGKICSCRNPAGQAPSPQRDISERIAAGDSDCSIVGSGSSTTAPSPQASKSTIATGSRPTTASAILNSSAPSITSASTRLTSGEPPTDGSGAAAFAASGNPPPPSTTTSAERDGFSTDDADPATSRSSSDPSSSVAPSACPSCGGVIEGGRRNVHPLADGQADRPHALARAARNASRRAHPRPLRRKRDDRMCSRPRGLPVHGHRA